MLMKQAVFLYNTKSGRGKVSKNIDEICRIFKDGGYNLNPQPIDFDKNPFESDKNIDIVIVAGGDGTINYAINRMKESEINIPIGIIPAGTANDFARALGMSKNVIKASKQIATGTIKNIDCGRVNGLYFVNILSFGVFTTTSQKTPDKLKHKVGKLAYMLEGVKEFFNIHTVPLKINADGIDYVFNSYMALILNGVTAGGIHLAPKASIVDGFLDCVILEKRGLVFSTIAMCCYILGWKSRLVKYIRAKNINITTATNEPTDVDGQKGGDFPLYVECLKGELQIIVPKNITKEL